MKWVWLVDSDEHQQTTSKDSFGLLKSRITSAAALLLPLLASIPPLGVWGGLMTIPFLMYLLLMIGSLGSVVLEPLDIFNIAGYSIGIILLLYSIAYLWKKKATGLVTTGPYSIVRHPQYFSIIVFTAVMTYQSVWILQHTFGFGWLSVEQTKIMWYIMLFAYVVIADIEEKHLEKVYGYEWIDYRNKVGFLIPFVRFRSGVGFRLRFLEELVCMLIPIVALDALLHLTA